MEEENDVIYNQWATIYDFQDSWAHMVYRSLLMVLKVGSGDPQGSLREFQGVPS